VQAGTVWCGANTVGGASIGSEACTTAVKPVVRGATLTCQADGRSS
jgi:hypothetical protein